MYSHDHGMRYIYLMLIFDTMVICMMYIMTPMLYPMLYLPCISKLDECIYYSLYYTQKSRSYKNNEGLVTVLIVLAMLNNIFN